MANTVEANIEVNAKMNTSSVDDGIQRMITEFNYLSSQVDKEVNNPLHTTEETINTLKNSLASLNSTTFALEGLIPEEKFEQALELVYDLKTKIDELKAYDDGILDLGFEGATESLSNVNGELELLKSDISADIELFNEFRDVMDQPIDSSGLNEALTYINTENTEEMRNAIGDILGINEELNESREQTTQNTEEANNVTVDYTKIVEQLANKLGLTSKETESFAKALGASAGEAAVAGASIAGIIAVIKVITDRMKEAEQALKDFGSGALDAGVAGVDIFIDGIHNLVEVLDTAMDKLKDFADAGAEIQRSYYNVFSILGSDGGEAVVNFTDKLETLYGLDASSLVSEMQSVVAAAGSLGVETDDIVKATENMTLMANDLSIIAGDFNKASNDIGNAISKGFIGRSSSLYVLMTKAEKDELKSLSSEVERYNYLMNMSGRIRERYEQFLGTEAGQLYILNQRYQALQSNIQMLALGLYAKIAPLLTKLIDLANIALTTIMKVFNLDIKGGANTGGQSIADGINKSISDVGKNAKKSGKEVNKLTKQVASFDDVIQINDNKSNKDSLADELSEISDIDLSGLYDLDGALKKTEDEFAEFKKLLDMGMYDSAGFWLADWVADKLEAIDWDKIQAGAKKAAYGLAQFLNGFIRNKRVWGDIGTTIAQGLNTAVDFLLEFARTFNFKELGDSLGVAWKAFWDGLDAEDFASMLYEWFMGIFELLGGFFDTNPLTNMAEKLVEIIHNFFNNFTDADKEQMAHTLQSILSDVFTAAFTLMSGLAEDTPAIIEFIKNMVDAAKDWFENGGGREAVQGIGNAILNILTELKDSGIIQDVGKLIREFIDAIPLGEILGAASKIALQVWVEKTLIDLKVGWEKVKAFFIALFDGTGENLKNLFAMIGGEVIVASVNLIESLLFGAFTPLFNKFKEFIIKNWDDIKASVSKILTSIIESIKTTFNNIISFVSGWITSIKDTIKNAFSGFNPFSGMSFNLPSLSGSIGNWFSGRHAEGGITNGASLGIIGEAGREAVLPLERNTGWMDTLAEKINSRQGQGDGSPVVIDMSKATKPVYTRAEYLAMGEIFAEAMKARGVAVAVNY